MKIKSLILLSTFFSFALASCGKTSSNSSSPASDSTAQIEGVWIYKTTLSTDNKWVVGKVTNSQVTLCKVTDNFSGATIHGPYTYSFQSPFLTITISNTRTETATYDSTSNTIQYHLLTFSRISNTDLVAINRAGCNF